MPEVELQNGHRQAYTPQTRRSISKMEEKAMELPFIDTPLKARLLLILIIIFGIALTGYSIVNVAEGPQPYSPVVENE